jgi:hypothetical protein
MTINESLHAHRFIIVTSKCGKRRINLQNPT